MHRNLVVSIEINPDDCGYELTEDDMLVPTIVSEDVIPEDFSVPCNCLKRLSLSCKTNKLLQIL